METIKIRDARTGKEYSGGFEDAEAALDYYAEKLDVSPALLELVDYFGPGTDLEG